MLANLLLTILLFSPSFIFAKEIASEKLIHILKHDCGSCHGMLLNGGLGSSLEKETLKNKSWQNLKFIILHGRPGTAMPAWKSILKDEEAEWIAKYLTQPKE